MKFLFKQDVIKFLSEGWEKYEGLVETFNNDHEILLGRLEKEEILDLKANEILKILTDDHIKALAQTQKMEGYGGWQHLNFLIFYIYFLIRQFILLCRGKIKDINIEQDILSTLLIHEIWIAINAFKIRKSFDNILVKYETEYKDIKGGECLAELQILLSQYFNFIRDSNAKSKSEFEFVFPCGARDHSMYLIFLFNNQHNNISIVIVNPIKTNTIGFNPITLNNEIILKELIPYLSNVCTACKSNCLEAEVIIKNKDTTYQSLTLATNPGFNLEMKQSSNKDCVPSGYFRGMKFRVDSVPNHTNTSLDHLFDWLIMHFKEFVAITPSVNNIKDIQNELYANMYKEGCYREVIRFNNLAEDRCWLTNNLYFVGRGDVLEKINKVFMTSNTYNEIKYFIIYGQDGIGKTTIAKQYAFKNSYNYKHIFFLSSNSQNALLQSWIEYTKKSPIINEYLNSTSISLLEKQGINLIKHINHCIEEHSDQHNSILLIYDNISNIGFSNFASFLKLVPKKNCDVIITKNQRWQDVPLETVISHDLKPFNDNEYKEYVNKFEKLSEEDSNIIQSISGNIPLILTSLLIHLHSTVSTVESMSKRLNYIFTQKSSLPGIQNESVNKVYNAIIQQMQNNLAIEILSFCYYCANSPIPVYILKHAFKLSDDFNPLNPLNILCDHFLISHNKENDSISLRVPKEVLAEILELSNDKKLEKLFFICQSLNQLYNIRIYDHKSSYLECIDILLHAQHIIDLITDKYKLFIENKLYASAFIKLVLHIALNYQTLHNYKIAKKYLENSRKLIGEENIDIDTNDNYNLNDIILFNLANIYGNLDKTHEKITLLNEILKNKSSNIIQISILYNLACAYCENKQFNEAEQCVSKAKLLTNYPESKIENYYLALIYAKICNISILISQQPNSKSITQSIYSLMDLDGSKERQRLLNDKQQLINALKGIKQAYQKNYKTISVQLHCLPLFKNLILISNKLADNSGTLKYQNKIKSIEDGIQKMIKAKGIVNLLTVHPFSTFTQHITNVAKSYFKSQTTENWYYTDVILAIGRDSHPLMTQSLKEYVGTSNISKKHRNKTMIALQHLADPNPLVKQYGVKIISSQDYINKYFVIILVNLLYDNDATTSLFVAERLIKLKQQPPHLLNILILHLSNNSAQIRRKAVELIIQIDKQSDELVVNACLKNLIHNDINIIVDALFLLKNISATKQINLYKIHEDNLNHDFPAVRLMAAEELIGINPNHQRVISVLINILDCDNVDIRNRADSILGKIDCSSEKPKILNAYLNMLQGPNPSLTMNAARSLIESNLITEEIIIDLISKIDKCNSSNQFNIPNILQSLCAINYEFFNTLTLILHNKKLSLLCRLKLAEILMTIDKNNNTIMIKLLNDHVSEENPHINLVAIEALVKHNHFDNKIIEKLIKNLTSQEIWVVKQTTQLIMLINKNENSHELLRTKLTELQHAVLTLYKSDYIDLKLNAILLIGEIKFYDYSLIEKLKHLLNYHHGNIYINHYTLKSLLNLDNFQPYRDTEYVIVYLTNTLHYYQPEIRCSSISLLGEIYKHFTHSTHNYSHKLEAQQKDTINNITMIILDCFLMDDSKDVRIAAAQTLLKFVGLQFIYTFISDYKKQSDPDMLKALRNLIDEEEYDNKVILILHHLKILDEDNFSHIKIQIQSDDISLRQIARTNLKYKIDLILKYLNSSNINDYINSQLITQSSTTLIQKKLIGSGVNVADSNSISMNEPEHTIDIKTGEISDKTSKDSNIDALNKHLFEKDSLKDMLIRFAATRSIKDIFNSLISADDSDIRHSAAIVLIVLRKHENEVVQILTNDLDSKDILTRHRAVILLTMIDRLSLKSNLTIFTKQLHSKHTLFQISAFNNILKLIKKKHTTSSDLLISVLNNNLDSQDDYVSQTAAYGLTCLNIKERADKIIRMSYANLLHMQEEIRLAAAATLIELNIFDDIVRNALMVNISLFKTIKHQVPNFAANRAVIGYIFLLTKPPATALETIWNSLKLLRKLNRYYEGIMESMIELVEDINYVMNINPNNIQLSILLIFEKIKHEARKNILYFYKNYPEKLDYNKDIANKCERYISIFDGHFSIHNNQLNIFSLNIINALSVTESKQPMNTDISQQPLANILSTSALFLKPPAASAPTNIENKEDTKEPSPAKTKPTLIKNS